MAFFHIIILLLFPSGSRSRAGGRQLSANSSAVVHTEERVTHDDGAQTTLERWGDQGPAILAIHGMTGSRKAWEQLALHYGAHARVYAYDQRGHGDGPPGGPMTLHRSLLDLYTIMSAIPQGVDTLVGHSWGGAIALLGGRRFDCNRVIAIDPMIRQADAAWYDAFFRELKKQKLPIKAIKGLRDENPPATWDLRADLERYPKPLLLAVGEGPESLFGLDDMKFVRERGGPNVALRVFEGQGHNLHRTDFDRFAREFDTFLARTP
jgi:pimeloyl-ACP methyl ester carboxylesterase